MSIEAKDTVMKPEEIVANSYELTPERFALRQAEISFKAGIKEVVEWLEKHELDIGGYTGSRGSICGSELWYAQKKEWGIEEIKV